MKETCYNLVVSLIFCNDTIQMPILCKHACLIEFAYGRFRMIQIRIHKHRDALHK